MGTCRAVALALSVVAALAAAAPAAAQDAGGDTVAPERYEAADFPKGAKPIVIQADQRETLGELGTIELGVTFPDPGLAPFPREMVLLSIEDGRETRLRVTLSDGGTSLGIHDGRTLFKTPVDLTAGGFFHIGLAATGDHTGVYVDDQRMGDIATGFGPSENLPVWVGGQRSGEDGFVGQMQYFRLWNRALLQKEFVGLNGAYSLSQIDANLIRDLLVYSQFTNRIAGVFFNDATSLADITRDAGMFVGDERGASFVDLVPADHEIHGFIVTGDDRIRSFQVLLRDGNGAVLPMPRRGTPVAGSKPQVFALSRGARLTGIDAMYDLVLRQEGPTSASMGEQGLSAVGFAESGGTSSGRLGGQGGRLGRSTAFRTDKPLEIDAVYGFVDRDGIAGIGFAPRVALPVTRAGGRWRPLSENPLPQQLSDREVLARGGRVPHGNYQDRRAVKLRWYNRGRAIELFEPGRQWVRFALRPDGTYADVQGGVLAFVNDDRFEYRGERYSRVEPYEDLDSNPDFQGQGNVFNLDKQVPLYNFMYHGYDITAMDPTNLQRAAGQHQNVFREPPGTSKDYHPALQRLVPNGMLIASAVRADRTSEATTLRTASEHSLTQSQTLGVSLGVPNDELFGAENTVTTTSQDVSSHGLQLVFTEERQEHDALVVDPAHVELDPLFRSVLLEAMDKRASGRPFDYRADIIEDFGTHYPNAMTTGLVARNLLRYSSQTASEVYKSGKSLSVNAKVVVEGGEAGFKFKKSQELSDGANRELEDQVERFTQVGSPGSWVPVYMDMRPLDGLVSLLFFDDRPGLGQVRSELGAAIRAYVAEVGVRFDDIRDIWEPYRFGLALNSISFRRADPNDLGREPTSLPPLIMMSSDIAVAGRIGMDFPLKHLEPVPVVTYTEDAPLVVRTIDDWDNPFWERQVDLPSQERVYVFSAEEFCAGFPHTLNLSVGLRTIRRIHASESQGSGILTSKTWDEVEQVHFVYPKELRQGPIQVTDEVKLPAEPPIRARLVAAARRLPSPEGGYLPLPECPPARP